MAKHVARISQLDARNAIKRVEQLEAQVEKMRQGLHEIPADSIPIAQTPHTNGDANALLPALIRNSQLLGHTVVATVNDENTVIYFALMRH